MQLPKLPQPLDNFNSSATAKIVKEGGGTASVYVDYTMQSTYMRKADRLREFAGELQRLGWPTGKVWALAESYERSDETSVPFGLDVDALVRKSRAQLGTILSRVNSGRISKLFFRVKQGNSVPFVEVRGDVPYLGELSVREHALAVYNAAKRLNIPVKWNASLNTLLSLHDIYQRWGNREKSIRSAAVKAVPPPDGGVFVQRPTVIVRASRASNDLVKVQIVVLIEKRYVFDTPEALRQFLTKLRQMGYRFPAATSPTVLTPQGKPMLPKYEQLSQDNTQTMLLLNRIKLMRGGKLTVHQTEGRGGWIDVYDMVGSPPKRVAHLTYGTDAGLTQAVIMAKRYPNVFVRRM